MPSALDRRALGAASLALFGASAPVRAQQNWPARPVAVVVPFAAGGSTDAVARVLAQRLSTDLGQNFVVDNRSGATGTIGMALVARARPDGHTLALAPGSTFAMAPHLYKLPYDNDRAFAGAGLVATMPMFLTVPGASPVRDLAGFLEAGEAPGRQLTYGHAGAGSSMHLAAELFLQVAGSSCRPSATAAPRRPCRACSAGRRR
jgi:tripartite-type tricarboxylate transporter receptor subunit TctC